MVLIGSHTTCIDALASNDSGAPEPPSRYRPDDDAFARGGSRPPQQNGMHEPDEEFDHVRKLLAAAQIMALVSIFIGGIVLSGAAVVVAIIGYRRTLKTLNERRGDVRWEALKRLGLAALAMAAIAFALNGIALALLYPSLIETLNSSEYSSLFSQAPQQGSSDSFWG